MHEGGMGGYAWRGRGAPGVRRRRSLLLRRILFAFIGARGAGFEDVATDVLWPKLVA